MNKQRQNELLKEAKEKGFFSSSELHGWLQAPSFTWNHTGPIIEPDEIEFFNSSICPGREMVPEKSVFKEFRLTTASSFYLICFYPDAIGTENKIWSGAVFPNDPKLRHVCSVVQLWQSSRLDEEKIQNFGWCGIYKNFKQVRNSNNEQDLEKNRGFFQSSISSFKNLVSLFTYDALHPSNCLLRVRPRKEGKSVDWCISREHYLVLNRKIAQSVGMKKADLTDHNVSRAAHWRRAHFRRLSSDRFKQKGNLIPVRQAWVGPKEWIGTDKKEYLIIDRN